MIPKRPRLSGVSRVRGVAALMIALVVAIALVGLAVHDSGERERGLTRERAERGDRRGQGETSADAGTGTTLGADTGAQSPAGGNRPQGGSKPGDGTGGIAAPGSSGAPLGAPTGSLQLGTLTDTGASDGCLPGAAQCRSFDVACPSVRETARGEVDIRPATGTPRGVAVFFSHAKGGSWWMEGLRSGDDFIDQLRRGGITMVQVRWLGGSWLEAAPGEVAGTSKVACRPATAIKWVHDTVFAPLGVDAGVRRCGFCITGVSGGASQVAYALGYYGLDSILDVVVPVSGPPHGDLTKGCLRRPGEEGFWYEDPSHILNIDLSYGYRSSTEGPCGRHDAGFVQRWDIESVARGATDYDHPATRIHFLIGGRDESPAPSHARAYASALGSRPSNHVTLDVDPTMPHGLNESGFDALLATLLA